MKKYQLPKEFATKWVEALRSGKYKQVKSAYKKDGCYCAVGVAYNEAKIPIIEGSSCTVKYNEDLLYESYYSLWVEITQMNDIEELSFSDIADWIEANIEFI